MSRVVPVLIALSVAGLAGCYRHVVEVRGPNAASYDVYEPNYDPDKEDPVSSFFGGLFGSDKDDKKR